MTILRRLHSMIEAEIAHAAERPDHARHQAPDRLRVPRAARVLLLSIRAGAGHLRAAASRIRKPQAALAIAKRIVEG